MEVYIYQGNKGEEVPRTVEKLIVEEGVQELPDKFCVGYEGLAEVTLPNNGLKKIGNWAFGWCPTLLEMRISITVKVIGREAFQCCGLLTKVTFEESSITSPHRLETVGRYAFYRCTSLQRIKLPYSVTAVGSEAFGSCASLVEVNLSTTGVAEIKHLTFCRCSSLQTVSLPKTVRRIDNGAFHNCSELVTVVVPVGSRSIQIGYESFGICRRLANLVLPKDSTAHREAFTSCEVLHERFGEDYSLIVAGLMGRFNEFPIHRMCYDHFGTTPPEVGKCISEQEEGDSLVDDFGMTPFHALFSTTEPSVALLEVLLDELPNEILNWKDANEKRPLQYLINNWTDETKTLLQRTLQKSVIDRVARWGAMSWMETMQGKVQEILAQDDKEQRTTLCIEVYAVLEHYENVEATSMLEMALWKKKLESEERTNDNSKREALDREEGRFLSGADVVIPSIATFLGIIKQRSD